MLRIFIDHLLQDGHLFSSLCVFIFTQLNNYIHVHTHECVCLCMWVHKYTIIQFLLWSFKIRIAFLWEETDTSTLPEVIYLCPLSDFCRQISQAPRPILFPLERIKLSNLKTYIFKQGLFNIYIIIYY